MMRESKERLIKIVSNVIHCLARQFGRRFFDPNNELFIGVSNWYSNIMTVLMSRHRKMREDKHRSIITKKKERKKERKKKKEGKKEGTYVTSESYVR